MRGGRAGVCELPPSGGHGHCAHEFRQLGSPAQGQSIFQQAALIGFSGLPGKKGKDMKEGGMCGWGQEGVGVERADMIKVQ